MKQKVMAGSLLLIASFAASVLPCRATAIIWTNAAGGDWSESSNWSPNQIPGASDSAAITTSGNYIVTISSDQSIGTLTLGASSGDGTIQTLSISSGTFTVNNASSGTAQGTLSISGGTLTGAATATLAGPFNWSGGTVNGAVVQFKGGTLTGTDFLDGGELINTGTLIWTNATLYDGLGSVISNAPGATINLTADSDGTQNGYGTPQTFYNAGQLTLSAGSGTAFTISDSFINTGTVAVNAGTLDLAGGGTNSSTITVAANATLQLGNNYTFTSASSITGAGSAIFNSGTVSVIGTYDVATNTFSGGTINFSGNYTINQAVTISGGTVNFNAGGSLTIPALTMSSGVLGGTLPITINGPFNWSGGTVNGAVVQFKGGTLTGTDFLDGGELINTGTLAWTNATLYDGAGSVISNASGATINLTADSDGTQNGYGTPQTFYNAGQLTLSAGSGTAFTISDSFINTGTVTVNSAMLSLSGNYSLTNGVLKFGINSAANFGQISLSGNPAALAGTISAILNSNYVPMLNAAFPVLTYGSFSGAFTNTNLPPVAIWQTIYNPVNVTIKVLKLVPAITWANPASIVYGTPLSSTQLDATAASPGGGISLTGPGTFTYNPPLGTILNASNNQTLSVTFTPSAADVADFATATATVKINVNPLPVNLTGTRAYNATTTVASTILSVANPVGSDAVTVASGSATLAAATVGSESITSVGSLVLGGAQAASYTLTGSIGSVTITAKALTMSGLSVPSSKIYDGTTTAVVSGSPGSLQTAEGAGTGSNGDGKPYSGDAVSLTGTATGTYNSKDVATASTVTFGGLNLNGAQAGDYSLTVQGGVAATVTMKALTMSGLSVPSSKIYDGTTTAVVSGSPGSLQTAEGAGTGSNGDGKPYSGDAVSLTGTATGTYNSKDVATARTVTFGGLSLNGAQAGDYSLTVQGGVPATITSKALTISSGISANNKFFDNTTTATLSSNSVVLIGVVPGDTVTLNTNGYSANFGSAGVGSGIAVTVTGLNLSGASAADYSLTQPTGLTASITVPSLQILSSLPNIVLSWPTNASIFVLNGTPSLASPITWTAVTSGITVSGTNNTFTTNGSSGDQYYKLIAP